MTASLFDQPPPCFILLGVLITGMLSFAVLLTKEEVIRMFHWPHRLSIAFAGMELWFLTMVALLFRIIHHAPGTEVDAIHSLSPQIARADIMPIPSPELVRSLEEPIVFAVGFIALGIGLFCYRIITKLG